MKLKQEKIRLLMVIGIYLACLFLLLAIIILVKNINEIKTDPIIYGIQKKGYEVCSCYDRYGNNFDYDSEKYIQKVDGGWNIILEE